MYKQTPSKFKARGRYGRHTSRDLWLRMPEIKQGREISQVPSRRHQVLQPKARLPKLTSQTSQDLNASEPPSCNSLQWFYRPMNDHMKPPFEARRGATSQRRRRWHQPYLTGHPFLGLVTVAIFVIGLGPWFVGFPGELSGLLRGFGGSRSQV